MYLKLEAADCLRLSDGSRVRSALDYYLWQAEQVTERGIARMWSAPEVLAARANHGRWICDCVHCGTPMFTHPEWQTACCIQCGARYVDVQFPDQVVVAVLCRRPNPATQNWAPGETIDALCAENAAHGLTE
jgi:hypothetical protein